MVRGENPQATRALLARATPQRKIDNVDDDAVDREQQEPDRSEQRQLGGDLGQQQRQPRPRHSAAPPDKHR